MPSILRLGFAVAMLGMLLGPTSFPRPAAAAEEDVDLSLVLVNDVSRSIDDAEFDLEKAGYAAAFADARVIAAISRGALGAVAVAYLEFAGNYEVRTVLDFTVIRDAASARAFVERLHEQPRSFWGRTSISAGIDEAVKLIGASAIVATRQVIDVCGDGTNNAGREVAEARDAAVAAGVTVNGLTILNDHPVSWTFAHVQPPGGLTKYYRENVTGGPGSFVIEIRDFSTFGEAMTRKLVSEIAGVAPAARPRLAAR